MDFAIALSSLFFVLGILPHRLRDWNAAKLRWQRDYARKKAIERKQAFERTYDNKLFGWVSLRCQAGWHTECHYKCCKCRDEAHGGGLCHGKQR